MIIGDDTDGLYSYSRLFLAHPLISISLSEESYSRDTCVQAGCEGRLITAPCPFSFSLFGCLLIARNSCACSLQMLAVWLPDLCSLISPPAAADSPQSSIPLRPSSPTLLASTVTTSLSLSLRRFLQPTLQSRQFRGVCLIE